MFVFGVFFRRCALPEGLATKTPQLVKFPKCLDLICYIMVLHISTTISMQVKTCRLCFEGTRRREIGFRAPGPESKV